MRNSFALRVSIGAIICLIAAGAKAQFSAGLEMRGKIQPSACSVSLTDGTVDFGVRAFASLLPGGTILGPQRTVLEIRCADPKRVTFSATDNRASSTISRTEVTAWPSIGSSAWATGREKTFGLGSITANGASRNIGAVAITLDTPGITSDGTSMQQGTSRRLLRSPKGEAASPSWGGNFVSSQIMFTADMEYTFGSIGTGSLTGDRIVTLDAITTASVPLLLQAVIARPSNLPPSDEIVLDGSLTFTLRYL